MFDFFEDLIEKLGVKLISDFSSKLLDFITDVKNNSNEKENNNDGNNTQIGSSGYRAQIGSSGNSAQIGSSGNSAKIGSSGDYAQIGSSGYRAQIGSSGDNSKIGSSGNWAQIGSSGGNSKIGSSGNSAQIGSSGDSAQIGSSGDYAKIGSSGYYAKIDINGKNSITFACGINNIIKAKKGTWISLAEFKRDNENNIIPIYALSAQIGNKEYKDYKNRILNENTYYCLYNKQFHPVDIYDGIWTIELSKKVRDGITIIKAIDMKELYNKEIKEMYIAIEGELSAHGYTLREAIDDLTYKKMENVNINEIVAEIKKTGKVTRSQYRAITGACSYGTNKFCEEHKIEDLEEIDIEELRKILINDYGAEKFWKLIDEEK